METFGHTFLTYSTNIAFASLLFAFALTVYRLLRGPSFADRVVALDTLMLIGIGFIIIKAVVTSEYSYVDVAIAMALVGFLATVAFARYIYRRALKAENNRAEGRNEDPGHDGAVPGSASSHDRGGMT